MSRRASFQATPRGSCGFETNSGVERKKKNTHAKKNFWEKKKNKSQNPSQTTTKEQGVEQRQPIPCPEG